MLEWQDYIAKLLSETSGFDGITLSLDDSSPEIGVPPVIKASILMLDRMQANQGRLNIMVFPEKLQSIFIFTLVKLLYNIAEGKIDREYNPEAFTPGERLRLGNAVAEFLGTREKEGRTFICLRMADVDYYEAPLEYLPLMQRTNAQRLRSFERFGIAMREARDRLPELNANEEYLRLLADYKTHMESSIVYMTSIINAKEMISNCKLCGKSVRDAILVGQANYEGTVRNVGVGQLGGTPAIVLASDLYTVSALARNRQPIQSVIIDGSNANALLSQLDALDELIRTGVPITCVTDIVSSFDLQPFLNRGFNLWRWDESCITDQLYGVNPLLLDQKVKNCAQKKVDYCSVAGNEISTAIRLLYAHRKEMQSASAQMLKLFDTLFSLSFSALRETVPFEKAECAQKHDALEECADWLLREMDFLSDDVFSDFSTVIECLKKVFVFGYSLPKNEALRSRLKETHHQRIALVVPERSNKNRVSHYWNKWCRSFGSSTTVEVFYPAEYYGISNEKYDVTVVVSWLKRAIMRKVLYSYNTSAYMVLLYDYEKRWKNYDTKKWSSALTNTQNREAIERSLAKDDLQISTSRFVMSEQITDEAPQTDEFSEIETILKENRYRQYIARGGQRPENETVEAIPVSFVGGYLAFYRVGHKIVSASKIIEHDAENIETKLPKDLRMGEFVVVRETDKDLIRELADLILEHSGKTEARELSSIWKEALAMETPFLSIEQIYERLQAVGSTRSYPAVRSWLTDKEMIAPQTKQDLEHIAAATGNDVLKEKLPQVFDAAQTVKRAHIQAGKVLSVQLRKRIVKALEDYGDIDPFNIWEPIEMSVDGIGQVRILKVIDIGDPVVVDTTDTNRLIDEE